MNDHDSEIDLATQFVALNDGLRADADGVEALQRLVDLAVSSFPGCDWAAVTTWPLNKRPSSLAASSEVAVSVDEMQYEVGDGPCLTAAAAGEPQRILDIEEEDLWPIFRAAVKEKTPVRGVLSFPIADKPHAAAINLYSGAAHAFDKDAFSLAALFAAHARVLIAHVVSSEKTDQIRTALTSSRQIGTAIGILMHTHKITSDEAFDLLRTSSQHLNRKVRDIADDVTHTGSLPDQS